MAPSSTDVLVVGGGPAGCATATRLARAGHRVTLLERRVDPSPIPRGDILVPATARELTDLGVDTSPAHRVAGTYFRHGSRTLTVAWPDPGRVGDTSATDTAAAPSVGLVWQRGELNDALRSLARDAGVDVRLGVEAVSPIVERGFVRGAVTSDAQSRSTDLRCRFLVVADGANSRFGRGLGTHRDRRWPYALSASTYVESPRSAHSWLETELGIPDEAGRAIAGHGWITPMGAPTDGGTGRLNIGVTVLSSYRDVFGVNVVKLLDRFLAEQAARWRYDPDQRLVAPVRMRTPLGGSVSPVAGPTFLVVGDAAGMANPFDGHGIGTGLVTGRIAAGVLDEALTVGNSTTLQRYPALLADTLGTYQKVGRLTARFLGRPWLLSLGLRTAMRSEAAMGAVLRIATGELRDDERGGAERLFRLTALAARFAPSW